MKHNEWWYRTQGYAQNGEGNPSARRSRRSPRSVAIATAAWYSSGVSRRFSSGWCAGPTRPAGLYWSMRFTYVEGLSVVATQVRMARVSSDAPGITRWRSSRPRRAMPRSSSTRSPTWRCISRSATRAAFGRHEVARAGSGRPILEVRHVDVDDPVEPAQTLRRVVGARIVYEGDSQSEGHGNRQRFQHLRNDVLGRHEVDVVAPLALQRQHHAREFLGTRPTRARSGPYTLADVEVLTEHAPQIAVREEDRTGTVPSA